MIILSMRKLLSAIALVACLVACIPSFSQSRLIGAIEITRHNSVMVLPVPATGIERSRVSSDRGLTFYMPVNDKKYPTLKFETSSEKGRVVVYIYGMTSSTSNEQALRSAKGTLLETYTLKPANGETVVAQKATALAKENVVLRFLDKTDATKRLTPPDNTSKLQELNAPCRARVVNASFTPQPLLHWTLLQNTPVVPDGCASCGGTTVCPLAGRCINTSCGLVCN